MHAAAAPHMDADATFASQAAADFDVVILNALN